MRRSFPLLMALLAVGMLTAGVPAALAEDASSMPASEMEASSASDLAIGGAQDPTEACLNKAALQTVLSPQTALSMEPAPALGVADPEFMAFPNHPCFRPPPPPSSCLCNGCCENCRCWNGGSLQKCVDRS